MERREFVAIGATSLIGSIAGCLSAPQQVNFQRYEDTDYQIKIVNNKNESVDSSLSIIGYNNGTEVSNNSINTHIKSQNNSTMIDPFPSKHSNYSLRLSTQHSEIEKNINLEKLQGQILNFTVSEEGIQYRTESGPLSDFNIYNATVQEREFDIVVTDFSSGSKYQGKETVPSGAIYTYFKVFDLGNEYNISVSVNGKHESTTIVNSRTNFLFISLDPDELFVDVGET